MDKKKLIAPVAITVLFLAYLAFYFVMVVMAASFSPLAVLLLIPLAALGVGMVYVLRSRINEIRSGEEDDLSNY